MASFAAAAFGLAETETVIGDGYVGAALDGAVIRVRFHWPAVGALD